MLVDIVLHYIMHVFVRHGWKNGIEAGRSAHWSGTDLSKSTGEGCILAQWLLFDRFWSCFILLLQVKSWAVLSDWPPNLISKWLLVCREATEPKFQVLGVSKDVAGKSWILNASKTTEVDVDGCVAFLAKMMEDRFVMAWVSLNLLYLDLPIVFVHFVCTL